MQQKPGWGTAVGWVFSMLPSKEESRRNEIAKLEKKREKILSSNNKPNNYRILINIDKRLQYLKNQAVNQ